MKNNSVESENRVREPRNGDSKNSRWTVGKRIYASSLLLVLVMVGISWFSIFRIGGIKAVSDKISGESLPQLAIAAGINNLLGDAHKDLLFMFLVQSSEERKAFQDKLDQYAMKMKAYFDEYEAMVSSDKERGLLDIVRKNREAYVKIRKSVIIMMESDMVEAKRMCFGELELARKAYSKTLEDILINSKQDSENDSKEIEQEVRTTIYLILLFSTLSIVIGASVSLFIVRSLNKTLNNVVTQVSSGANQIVAASGEVSAASQSLAEGASEQAASLEETSSSLEELSSTTKRNAESAQNAKTLADKTNEAALAGAKCVQDMRSAMDKIQTSSSEMRSAMDAVKESNDEVAKIIKTIDEIAFQTNILALNAAVEAARAGEAGMGFAVVADEVRNLAQKSAAAARETAEKIKAAIERTEVGVRVSDKVVDDLKAILEQSRQVESSLKGIEEKSREVDVLVGEIATASREQSQGIEQVNVAVSQMDKVTQSTAANAEESASAAKELNAQAKGMKESVKELLRLVGGKHGVQ